MLHPYDNFEFRRKISSLSNKLLHYFFKESMQNCIESLSNQIEMYHEPLDLDLDIYVRRFTHSFYRDILDSTLEIDSYMAYHPESAFIGNKKQNMTSSLFSNINTYSFKDAWILNFHKHVQENNLTAFCSYQSKTILKKDFEHLLTLATSSYVFEGSFNGAGETIECFIDNHTYFSLNNEDNSYVLTAYFSHDPEIGKLVKNLEKIIPPPYIKWCTGLSPQGELMYDHIQLDPPSMISDAFYPWLGQDLTLREYLNNYLESEESILLLYGAPGTGKSNLLKYLLAMSGESALITYQDSIRDLDVMFSSFLRSDNKFLIIEDADEFLIKREQGNTAMKRLLNVADGLTSNKNKKIIFTTNLTSTAQIDDALLREGRCYDSVNFKPYDKAEAMKVAEFLSLDSSVLTKSQYTLAELFSAYHKQKKPKRAREATASFGFGSAKA